MKSKYLLIVSGVTALSIGIWFTISLIHFKGDVKIHEKLTSDVEMPYLRITSDGKINDTVSYTDLINYNKVYSVNRPDIADISRRFTENKGTGIWFLKSRKIIVLDIDSLFSLHDYWYENTKQVSENLSDLHLLISKKITEDSNGRKIARKTFTKVNDNEEFKNQSNEIKELLRSTINLRTEVLELQDSTQFQGMAKEIRLSILKHFEYLLDHEIVMLNNRNNCLVKVNSTLSNYKSSVAGSVSTSYGTIATLNSITNRLHPVVSVINYKVKPVRDVLEEMNKPIIGSNLGRLLGSVYEDANSSTIDIIKNVDPITGAAIESISKLVSELKKLEIEINTIISKTQPFLSSVNSFQKSRSRGNMLKVIESGPNLNDYILSRKGIFNPLVLELDKVKTGIHQLNAVAKQRIPAQARSYIYQLTGYATEIVNVCYYPFDEWEEAVVNIADPIGALSQNEEEYMKFVNELSSETATVGSSTIPSLVEYYEQPVLEIPPKKQVEELSTSSPSSLVANKIKTTLESYYELLDDENLEQIFPYYTDPVNKWFDSQNISVNEINSKARSYYNRWPYHTTKINWSTLSVIQISNGNYKIGYDMDYWLKKKASDPYKYYFLKIQVIMTPQYKINEIDEVIVKSKTVSSIGSMS